jgi:HlyD family secretion protein
LPVSIRVDALKDDLIEGVVTKVNPYAEASSYSSGNIKKYATIIKIKESVAGLRVGMNAEVRIHVERSPDTLQVPVQALAELKGHFFTLVRNNDHFETREIKIGSTNDKVATITSGLKDGDEVVMNPRSTGSLLKLPNLPDATPIVMDEIKRNELTDSPAIVATSGGKGGKAGGAPGGGKGFADMSPSERVAQYLENDTDKDGKLSKDELSKMDERMQQRLAAADTNNDGFLERRELLTFAAQMAAKMKARGGGGGGSGGGGPGGFGGGRRGGGGEGGPPNGGPAGGGE